MQLVLHGKCLKSLKPVTYRKTCKEARGSYSFSEAQNAGLIRNWAFLPNELCNYCGSY